MDNGVDVVDNKARLEEADVAAVDGKLQAELAGGDAHETQGLEEDWKNSEENEVFEEAMDDVLAEQLQHEQSTYSHSGVVTADGSSDDTREVNGTPLLVPEPEKFDKAEFAQCRDLTPKVEIVVSKEEGEDFDVSDHAHEEEDGREIVVRKTNERNGMVAKGEADNAERCFSVPVDVGRTYCSEALQLVEELSENGNSVSNKVCAHVPEKSENGESGGGILGEKGIHVASNDFLPELNEILRAQEAPCEVVMPEEQGSLVDKDTSFDEEEAEVNSNDLKPLQVLSGGDDGVQPDISVFQVKEKETHHSYGIELMKEQQSLNEEVKTTSNGKSDSIEEAVEVIGQSSFCNKENREMYTQPAVASISPPISFSVPCLPSNGKSDLIEETAEVIGQSSSCNKENREMFTQPAVASISPPISFSAPCSPSNGKTNITGGFEKEVVTIEDVDESSSSDKEDNSTSAQPALADVSSPRNSSGSNLQAHPAGLGSSSPNLRPHPAGLGSPVPNLRPHPAGLGSSAPLLEPAPRAVLQPRANGSVSHQQSQPSEDPTVGDVEENDETREKLQMIRVKFLRLAHRLGQTPHNVVVAQVLYRLGLAEQLRGSRNPNRAASFSFDRASAMAEQLEAAGQEPLEFSCTILVIGKTGVGKSASINSIFDDVMFRTDAFHLGTKKVQEIEGTVQGIKVRVIDTPGLSSSSSDQRKNEKILHSVKRYIKKTPPDIVLYLDRLDMQSRDYGDVPLLRTITDIFGPSIWFNAIVVLTHAASAPPDGPNGTPLSYEMFVTQRSHVVQQAIRQAAGDLRLMNPVSLVENHSACRMNRAGQRVLPNGQVWKPQLLLLSFASKILAEANTLLSLQDSPPSKPSGARSRVPPLPFLLSSLLQSRPQLKLPEDQLGDEDAIDEDLDEASDSGDEAEYDELPPFRCLTRAQLAKLSKAQRKSYYEELDYREKLFFKKQLKEEKKRRKLLKKMAVAAKDLPDDHINDNLVDESSGPASVAVPMPDLVLPTSFDSDYPSHRYRFLDSSNQWLVRPVLESQGWDHDVGYEGLNVEWSNVLKDKIPVAVSGQFTKDKKECTMQMEVASSIKHGEGKATSLGVDMQTVGKDMAYTLRGETSFMNFRRNNTATGVSATFLGDTVSGGLKIEDNLVISKRLRLLATGGAMTGRGDLAYGGRIEATLRDKDYPIGRTLLTLALSIVDWHGDLAIGCNVQSQLPIGRATNVIGHANWSNRGNGQVGVRVNSSEQLQIALVALVPILRNVKRMFFGSSQSM